MSISANFRLATGPALVGPWTWGSYGASITATAGQYIKVELESTANVDTISVTIPATDEVTYAAGAPTVTTDSVTKTATFQVPVGATGRCYTVSVSVTGANGASDSRTLNVDVLTADGFKVFSLDERYENDSILGWLAKLNAIARSAITMSGTAGTEYQHLEHDGTNWAPVSNITLPAGGTRTITLGSTAAGAAPAFRFVGGDAAAGDGGDAYLMGGSGGGGGSDGVAYMAAPDGSVKIEVGDTGVGFYGGAQAAQQTAGWYYSDPTSVREIAEALNATSLTSGSKSIDKNADGGKWFPLTEGTDYTGTASLVGSAYQVPLLVDFTDWIRAGTALRFLDLYGIPILDTLSQIGTFENATGITSTVLDARGRLWASVVDDGAGFYHLELYNREGKTASDLVAHTASYNSVGLKALVADNSSGIGGTVDILAVAGADADIYIEFYRWYQCYAITATTLDLLGTNPSTGAGNLTEMWVGRTGLSVEAKWHVPGDFSTAATDELLLDVANVPDMWRGENARICAVNAWCKAVSGGAAPDIDLRVYNSAAAAWFDVTGGISMGVAQNMEWGIPSADTTQVNTGDEFELSTTLGAAGDQNLSVDAWMVLE